MLEMTSDIDHIAFFRIDLFMASARCLWFWKTCITLCAVIWFLKILLHGTWLKFVLGKPVVCTLFSKVAFLRWGCINKLDLSTLTDSSVGRCNIAFLRVRNQSPLADCSFSSENRWNVLLFSYAFMCDCECICACMCLCVYVHASSPLRGYLCLLCK